MFLTGLLVTVAVAAWLGAVYWFCARTDNVVVAYEPKRDDTPFIVD